MEAGFAIPRIKLSVRPEVQIVIAWETKQRRLEQVCGLHHARSRLRRKIVSSVGGLGFRFWSMLPISVGGCTRILLK